MKKWLNSLADMVILLDGNGRVLAANAVAIDEIASNLEQQLIGSAADCYYSAWPHGCGEASLCNYCSFRRVLSLTIEEQHAFDHVRIPLRFKNGFYDAIISTKPIARFALVQIHSLTPNI